MQAVEFNVPLIFLQNYVISKGQISNSDTLYFITPKITMSGAKYISMKRKIISVFQAEHTIPYNTIKYHTIPDVQKCYWTDPVKVKFTL